MTSVHGEKGEKMARMIDADALDNAFTELRFNVDGELAHWGDRKDWCLHGNEIEKLIADAPTVDPIKHGHWIEVQRIHEKDHTAICECSLCGDTVWVYDGQRAWNYCPRCGAKMDERET